MVLQSKHPIPIIHLESADVTPENRQYKEMLSNWFGITIPSYKAEDKPGEMQRILDTYNARAVLYGVRGDQSSFRSTIQHAEAENGRICIYPLLRMTQTEAALYLIQHALPIHPSGFPGKKTTVECGLHVRKCR